MTASVTKLVLFLQKGIQNNIALFTYTYISDGPLKSMSEVIAKNEMGLFYDKSILEDGVEFIGLINKQGKMENTLFKNEINLTKERKEMFSMELRLQISMQSDFDSEFGTVSYTVTEREKSKFVSILALPYIVLAVMKKNIDHIAVINKIKTKIRHFENINKELSVQKSDQV
jgi:hypothetical protein